MERPDMGDDLRDDDELRDSVDRDTRAWLAELPGVDAEIETARMRLRRLAKLSERMLAGIAKRHGLSVGDWETLSVLRRSGPPYVRTPSELMHLLGVTSGTISVRIERLQQAGLIEPAEGAPDERFRPVRLTAEGARRWSAATNERTALEARFFQQALDPIEIEYLNHLLRLLLIEMEHELAPVTRGNDGH